MRLPDDLVAYLAHGPVIGDDEQILPLLTVDEMGAPHACLLCRAQVTAVPGEIRAAISSPGTRENLAARPAALLLVTLGETVHHCGLSMAHATEADGVLGAVFAPVSHKADGLGIALSPATFVASEAIAEYERWDETAALLGSLPPLSR